MSNVLSYAACETAAACLSQPPHPVVHAVQVVARVFALPPSELLHATRGPAGAAFARQIAMYLAHVEGGLSLTDVGEQFRRDRTTVAYACRLIETRRDDPHFDRVVQLLEWILPVFASRKAPGLACEF